MNQYVNEKSTKAKEYAKKCRIASDRHCLCTAIVLFL